ncbi:piggyBac transposable element-derived protein 2-like [Rhipicephalus sanguineus]|uniref:piggyBac transposable element-derived protein 2-like n=1 Tax=Rhipicephalus sanguineus TaxID=34632 RepID=UPI0020C33F25|nr:piggyBac transposable element-derived protein 2-like [Rhipicephalus sanguineus]
MAASRKESARKRPGRLLSDEEIQELLFQSDIDLSDEDDILAEPRSSSECSGSSSDDDDEVEDDTPASHKVQGRGPIWKATDGRCPARQYVPSKPNPVGLKNFVLSSSDGLVLDFVIYTGKGTVPEADTKELGLGGAIVKRLLHTVPEEQPVHVFTDRFFTGLNLAEYLLRRNAHVTGTIMANRTGGAASKLPNEKSMKRGKSCCVVRSEGEMCLTKWKDRKSVMILSTACGITPEGTCRRWSKEERKKVDVPQPHCIKTYNKNMGGVDLADRYVSYYRTKIRTKKWTIRVFAHFLDPAVANAWIEYRNDCKLMDVAAKDILDQFEFKNRVAETLIRAHVDEMQEAVNEVEQDLEIGETAALAKRTKVTSMPPTPDAYFGSPLATLKEAQRGLIASGPSDQGLHAQ